MANLGWFNSGHSDPVKFERCTGYAYAANHGALDSVVLAPHCGKRSNTDAWSRADPINEPGDISGREDVPASALPLLT